MAVNGNSLVGLDKQDAINLLRSSPRLIQLVINSQVSFLLSITQHCFMFHSLLWLVMV